jgi:hypothetical protein
MASWLPLLEDKKISWAPLGDHEETSTRTAFQSLDYWRRLRQIRQLLVLENYDTQQQRHEVFFSYLPSNPTGDSFPKNFFCLEDLKYDSCSG